MEICVSHLQLLVRVLWAHNDQVATKAILLPERVECKWSVSLITSQ